MGKLSKTQKELIVQLSSRGMKCMKIKKVLEGHGYSVSRQTVAKLMKKYKTTGSVRDAPRSGRPTESLSNELLDFVDGEMEKNNELTAPGLQKLIESKFNVSFSLSKVKRLRYNLGWIASGTKYCQLIRDANKEKRVAFCKKCLEENDQFQDVIFTDECSVLMENHATITFRRKWEPPIPKGRPKHPTKVHVWAGISARGATDILIFDGIMASDFYVGEILERGLLPFIERAFPDGYRLFQDNDPKHTSGVTKDYIQTKEINWWPSPPESPDLNPIEMMWHQLKHHLRVRVKPRTKDELVQGISNFWTERVTPEKCRKYISHLQKVVPIVIERQGKASGH